MLLSARILENITDANNYDYANTARWTQGDSATVYLQLIDLSKDTTSQGFKHAGRRYVPATGATLQVSVLGIDDSKKIVRMASQPYASDTSIFCLSIFATDTIVGSLDIQLKLTEGTKITRGSVRLALSIEAVNAGKST